MSDCQPGGSGFNFRPGRGLNSQGSHSQILMTGDPTEAHIYPKRSQLQNLSPQKITTFLAYPQKSLNPFIATQKIPLFFSRPENIPASFIDSKKITFGQNFRTKKITRTTPSLKCVSGALGLNFGRPSFATPSVQTDAETLV